MVRISRVVRAVLLTGVAAMAAAETVYKWVDKSGQIHYTDLPPRQGDAKVVAVYQEESGVAEDDGSDNGNNPEERGGNDDQSDQTAKPRTAQPPVPDDVMAAAEADAAK